MVLEATMLVLDNSEWMRNGDYTPSRLEAQKDAVTLLFNVKTQANPESTVGLMTMAAKGPEVLVTLTSDIGKVLTALHHIKMGGKSNLNTGVQIATLALKHRQNKNQRQRVIVFVGSPVAEDEATLVKLGKKLKKNNVAVDIVNFGEQAENTAKLEAFIAAINSGDNSHLVTIPPGPHILSDILITSPIVQGDDDAPPGFANTENFEFGVDPNLDPELALALRISLEEEKARQEASSKTAGDGTASTSTTSGEASSKMEVDNENLTVDEDAELTRALAMSLKPGGGRGGAVAGPFGRSIAFPESNEDDELARALAMSMEGGSGTSTGSVGLDINALDLGSLPGVDPNDPRFKAMQEKSKESEKKDDKKQ
ncbi:hypothetical protein SeMB42_g01300 [Synchytrium endobioticum]|uniref:VWFA domain-containing protein n=1 Tax=Synchytrium endobioticum TaxID=286115 RepID=A0A507D3J7_9FUNG|nr:hypothetical protein SeLEV6574_g03460 [Synchytrium endobioticum]TPX52598.1 hypothetical protein SeMB42_g01300 [Synchytrium endobioticum]